MISSLKNWIVRKLGGFNNIDEFIDGKGVEDKKYVLTLAVKRLFNTIGSEDILKLSDSGQWLFEGKVLNDTDKAILITEATQFLETKLWKIIQKDINWQANRKMFLIGKSEDDLVAGKLWLLTLDAIRTRLQSIRNQSAVFNKTG
jgi:hypothetical protein